MFVHAAATVLFEEKFLPAVLFVHNPVLLSPLLRNFLDAFTGKVVLLRPKMNMRI